MFRPTLASLFLTASLPAATQVFQTFEGDGFDTWQTEGNAFGIAPVAGKTEQMESEFSSYSNNALAVSTHGGDASKGSLTSPDFTISKPYIAFLIAGGDYPGKTAAQLIIDGKVVRETVGKRSLRCEPALWDVTEFKGRKASIRIRDDESGPWGIIGVDQITFTDYPNEKFPATTRDGKAHNPGLVPAAAIAGVNIPPGSNLKVEATHKEQQITSPTAITFDEQGRIYISETHRFRAGVEDDRNHLYWYLDDLAAMKTSDRRALHEKWKGKVSIEKLTEKSEVIRRLGDTDGDGKIDESKIYAEGFNDVLDGTAAGVFFHEGSLYFSCIPKIHMMRDTNGDGAADERKVVEEGFGVRISLSGHDLNGFTLGPDGRIYGTSGDRGASIITKEGLHYDYPNEGFAFSFEPDGTDFQIFHTGLRNPKEIAFDALGNAFSVDNNSDQGDAARVVYLVEGGDSGWQMEHQAMHTFHRQIGLNERPPSRWMDEKMWELENPVQPAFILPPSAHLTAGPSGLTVNPGAGFLESEAGRFLVCDYRGGSANSGIWSFEMKPKGAGMDMTDSRPFAWGIAATDVEYSWDGKVFISDFMGGWTTHDDGRILSLDAGDKTWQAAEVAGAAKIMREGFEQRSSAELANLLKHPDARIRLRAQIAISRTLDAYKRFAEATDSSDFMVRIHGIWGLGILSRRGSSPIPFAEFGDIPALKTRQEADAKLMSLLNDKSPEIRSQALRVLADSKGDANLIPLGPLLVDESPRVRFFAAILVGKRKMIGYYGPICDMLKENDNRDVYLRHAGAYALQNMSNNPAILSVLVRNESPALRLAATVALRRKKSPGVSAFINDPDPKVADEAIRAICDNDMVAVRPTVEALLDTLPSRTWTPFMLRRLIHNAFRIGTAENAARVLKFAADPQYPEVVRQEALRLLSIWTEPFPADQLTGHWRPLEKRDPAIIRPVLVAAMPELLRQDGFVLTAALEWVGHYQLKVPGLDEAFLRNMVKSPALPAAARAAALDLFIQHQPQDINVFLAEIATDASDEVALTAITAIGKLSPDTALLTLESAVDSEKIHRAQKTWGVLATLPGNAVDALFVKKLDELRAANGISPSAIELTSAAKMRRAPDVKSALAALAKSLDENKDSLAKWNSALKGGDPIAGAAIFTSHPASQCMRCHRAEEGHSAGGDTAPNLAGISKRYQDHRYFLESMINPGAIITPGFGVVLVDFKNGASLSGNLMAETPEHLDIVVAGKSLRILRSDTTSITSPASPMPPMGSLLDPSELRDIVAWLASLDHGGGNPPPAINPSPLDPATLKGAGTSQAPAAANGIDPAFLKVGKEQFVLCAACHGLGGEGTAAGPPLAGSEWVLGPVENLIRIQLRGLQGPIVVKSKEYNFPAGMAPLAYQTDEQIAAALTYVRNSFGNSAPPVSPASVSALRTEVGKPPMTAAGLIAPEAPIQPTGPTAPPATGKYDSIPSNSSYNMWIALGIGMFVIGNIVAAMKFIKK